MTKEDLDELNRDAREWRKNQQPKQALTLVSEDDDQFSLLDWAQLRNPDFKIELDISGDMCK